MSGTHTSLRVIMIGGTSHAGKSTVARQLADMLGWECVSTDLFARHPGRPWRNDGTGVPPHVVKHFSALSVDDLLADVLSHYKKNVMPQVEAMVTARSQGASSPGLVLEGSAIWPNFVAHLINHRVAGLWITCCGAALTARMHAESRYPHRTPEQKLLIDKFLQRTLVYQDQLEMAIAARGMAQICEDETDTPKNLASRCLQKVASLCGDNRP